MRTLASGRAQPGHLPRPATGPGGGPWPARVGTQAGHLGFFHKAWGTGVAKLPLLQGAQESRFPPSTAPPPRPLSGPPPWAWPPQRSAPMSGWSWSPGQLQLCAGSPWEGPGIGDTGTIPFRGRGHHVWSIQRARGTVFESLFHPRHQATGSPRCRALAARAGPAKAPRGPSCLPVQRGGFLMVWNFVQV